MAKVSWISSIIIIIANLLTLGYYIAGKTTFITIFMIYLLQGIIVGYFFYKKIATYDNFIIKGYPRDKNLLSDSRFYFLKRRFGERRAVGMSFLLRYIIVHLAYLVMIFITYTVLSESYNFFTQIDILSLVLGAILFFITHLISFHLNKGNDSANKIQVKNAVDSIYFRVVPLHLISFVLVAGGFTSNKNLVIIFILLKIFTDVTLHIREHNNYRVTVIKM